MSGSMDDKGLELIRKLNSAMLRRDRKEVYRLSAAFQQVFRPGQPIDLDRVKAVAHTYAAEMHGWEMDE
jgi:hypothetical protein